MIINGSDIFYFHLGVAGTIFWGYIHRIFEKLSQGIYEINSSLAEKPKEKTEIYEIVVDYLQQILKETDRKRLEFRLSIVGFIISLVFYPKWQQDIFLSLPIITVFYLFFRSISFEKFYEKTLARGRGVAKNIPTSLKDFLDRLGIKDKDERKGLIESYEKYKKERSEEIKLKLFDKLP